jgi:hypothetical protein
MPIDTVMFCAAVVSMFAVFAGAVIWGGLQTPREQQARLPAHRD